MWLNQQLNQNSGAELPLTGKVTRVENGRVDVSSFTKLADVPCAAGFGLRGTPSVGDTALIVPANGGYYCIGMEQDAPLPEGETALVSSGGAEIRLCADGSIRLNGLVITRDGVLIPAQGGTQE